MAYLKTLCRMGSTATVDLRPDVQRLHQAFGKTAAEALAQILCAKNGLYVLFDAVHVLSDADTEDEPSIYTWNDQRCWREHYRALAPKGVCFAEDVFGNQFVLRDNAIFVFDAESGSRVLVAPNLEVWAKRVLRDPVWSGWQTALAWQRVCGTLPRGYRLVPRVPFVRGRDIPVAQLDVVNAVEAMQTRGARAWALYARGALS